MEGAQRDRLHPFHRPVAVPSAAICGRPAQRAHRGFKRRHRPVSRLMGGGGRGSPVPSMVSSFLCSPSEAPPFAVTTHRFAGRMSTVGRWTAGLRTTAM